MSLPRIRFALFVTICVLSPIGCERDSRNADLAVKEMVASFESAKLETEADVERVVTNAATSERAIMFVNVDWAIMEPQRTRFAQFAINYHRNNPDDSVLFHYVDCTPVTNGYAPLRSLAGWRELQEAAGTALIHGWGELVWMHNGRVLHVERILNFKTTEDLIEKTNSLMPQANRG